MKVLVVVDMQNDFIDGALGTPEAVNIVDNVVKRIENSDNEMILFTKDTHQEHYLNTKEGRKLPIIHCVERTEGWMIKEEVLEAWRNHPNTIKVPGLEENAIVKPLFGSTKLMEILGDYSTEISEIEILGLCTDVCVISNAIMIKNMIPEADKVSVNAKCCAGVTPKTHAEALSVMQMCHIDVI